jgi:phosphoribosylaminoimidazole carboxylase PurK protein
MAVPEAEKLGIEITVLDPQEQSPANQAGASQIVGSYGNAADITKLANQVEIVSVDLEHVNAEALITLQQSGTIIRPDATSIALIQNKYEQTDRFARAGIPVPRYRSISSIDELRAAVQELGAPIHLKAAFGSYDGKGNAMIQDELDIRDAWESLNAQKRQVYVEEHLSFDRELAIMVARDINGDCQFYPVVETVQENSICRIVRVSAEGDHDRDMEVQDLARDILAQIEGPGIFGIELFEAGGHLLLNEVAPRPHNSGHYTIEACRTSQFANYLRAVTGRPLESAALKPDVPAAVMYNILGEDEGPYTVSGIDSVYELPGASVHWYQKQEVRPGRKMGHITVVADSVEEAEDLAIQAASRIEITVQS